MRTESASSISTPAIPPTAPFTNPSRLRPGAGSQGARPQARHAAARRRNSKCRLPQGRRRRLRGARIPGATGCSPMASSGWRLRRTSPPAAPIRRAISPWCKLPYCAAASSFSIWLQLVCRGPPTAKRARREACRRRRHTAAARRTIFDVLFCRDLTAERTAVSTTSELPPPPTVDQILKTIVIYELMGSMTSLSTQRPNSPPSSAIVSTWSVP